MPSLPAISTAGAVVGQVFGPISWINNQPLNVPKATFANDNTQQNTDYVVIYNESQCGMVIRMLPSQRTFRVPAGAWSDPYPVSNWNTTDQSLTATVEYVLSNPLVTQLGVDYFAPGEPLVISHTLGNSPIGGVVSGVVASSVVNTGNAPGTNVVVSNSTTANDGAVLINNDGSGNRSLQSNGAQTIFESWVEGGPASEATVTYGNASDLRATTFNGETNFDQLQYARYGTIAGTLTPVGGWYICANKNRQFINANGLTTILSYTTVSTGAYRISGYFNKQNATASAVTFQYAYSDPDGTNPTHAFCSVNAGAFIAFGGSTTITNGTFSGFTVLINALVATNIVVSYNDPTGVPSDEVTTTIEIFL